MSSYKNFHQLLSSSFSRNFDSLREEKAELSLLLASKGISPRTKLKDNNLAGLLSKYYLSLLKPLLKLENNSIPWGLFRQDTLCLSEIKYTLLLAHGEASQNHSQTISFQNLKDSYKEVKKNINILEKIEKIDFSFFSTLVQELGYRNFIEVFEKTLIEKIYFDSHESYKKTSHYMGIPMTTLVSKRKKYLKYL